MATNKWQPVGDAEHPSRWQFSVGSLILASVYVAFMLGWLRWFWSDRGPVIFYPGRLGFLTIAVLLVAALDLRRDVLRSRAWNLLALAWLMVLANIGIGFRNAFFVMSADPPEFLAYLIRQGLYEAIVSAVTLPLFFAIPVLCGLGVHYQARPTETTRWVYGSMVLATVNVSLLIAHILRVQSVWAG
ncbi:MAG: hypothetical protein DWQ42_14445 [Planctomycetota bacterium]|nr:MAG: hypothetical protein DWQ42_14445 [Planctomycetota bacterium]REK44702.1 MAG: hypothetical protein DWQ46_08645 [Planctomycetota bacterium]